MRKIILVAFLISLCSAGVRAQDVSRDMSDPDGSVWKPDDWVTARGVFASVSDKPEKSQSNAQTLKLSVTYPAKTFAYWGCTPINGTIPGNVKKISGWVRSSGDTKGNGGVIRFSNDKGEGEVKLDDGKKVKLEVGYNAKPGEWVFFEKEIPAAWPRPLKFNGIAFNNWFGRNEADKKTSMLEVHDLRIYTDIDGIATKDLPVDASVTFPVPGNIFYDGEDKVIANIVVGSWLGEEMNLTVESKVVSVDGSEKKLPAFQFKCLDTAKKVVELPFTAPGGYTFYVDIKGLPEDKSVSHRYVVAKRPPVLTEEQKLISPYGLNIHSGTAVDYSGRVARLGFTWVRDYAFNYQWMVRARGEGNYGSWPWYPKIMEGIESAGLKVLPCLMTALQANPELEEPNVEWRRNIAHIIASFPNINCWEIDNEFSLGKPGYDEILSGKRYGAYHKAFAEISKAIAPGNWAVTQGAAGIPCETDKVQMKNGYFSSIDVLNGHRYCGTSAPEISKENANTGQSDAVRSLLRDVYKEWDKVARLDGKDRQTWITEWGWDTKAGQPVSEWEQAAYIQRGYMLGFACGIDKMFWYWYDSSTEANAFFDGCGIFDHPPLREPKPVAASFAFFRNVLLEGFEYVGYANLSPNAMAQIFKTVDGKYVAAAFLINPESKEGLTVNPPKHEAAYDMFGAKIPGGKRALNIAPTWYIGIPADCDWMKQTPVEVESKHFERCVSGEAVKLECAKTGAYSVKTPKGWTQEKTDKGFSVTVPEGTPRGDAALYVTGVNEGVGKLIKIDVDVIPEAFMKGQAVGFDGTFEVRVENQSSSRKKHTVRPELPAGWKVEPETATTELNSGESATVKFKLLSSTDISPDAKMTPKLRIYNEKGMDLDQVPVVPREWKLKQVSNIKLDGDFDEWPKDSRLPTFMLGPRGEKETAEVRFGYAPEGLYVGVKMLDSKAFVADPTAFWRAADCMEIMFGPIANFKEGAEWASSDRQFWLCPLVNESRVYLGGWSRHDSVKQGEKEVKSFARKIDGGYAFEILIPASEIGEWNPKKGAEMAMSFTIAVKGLRKDREVFWPASKIDNVVTRPWMWGRIKTD